jgi:flavin reductase (DIM6/NTAB) family NADH-FMN oxidoreductase RutF
MEMDPQHKRAALRAINYGLYVVTAKHGDQIGAAGVNWVTQASFEPPLVVVCIKEGTDTHDLAIAAGGFVVNVVGEDQIEVAKSFFRPTVVEDGKLNGFEFHPSPVTGAPHLVDLPYWFEATVEQTVHTGDHTIVIGRVVGAGVHDDSVTPLVLRSTGMSYGG